MKKTIIFLALFSFLFFGAGCVKVRVGTFDGGVYKSTNKGSNWQQKVDLLAISSQPKKIASVNITAMVFDPQDSKTIYIGTENRGAFVTFDEANSWQEIRNLPRGKVTAIAVHPFAKHIVYIAIGERIFKSSDCCRTWKTVYLENQPDIEITTLAIDRADPKKVLAGLSDGRLIRSMNSGSSWSILKDFHSSIKQILFNPHNTGIIYVSTKNAGLWKTTNGGADWKNLDESLKNFSGGRNVKKMIFDRNRSDSIITLSSYGILRTDNGGKDWTSYKLLYKPGKIKIYSFAINPQNSQEIYYTTEKTFYRTSNGGLDWQPKSLPTKRAGKFILVDPNNPSNIYLGVAKEK
ncbi:hypothetical protein J7K86_01210 [bacterium]|nr:hypothetical protein [bacterium]